MSHPVPPIRGPLCTRALLAADFQALGIRKGDVLLVHSSLKSMGYVVGGSETVIFALQDALGISSLSTRSVTSTDPVSEPPVQGTLVVPTQTGNNSDPSGWCRPPVPSSWHQAIRDSTPAYDPQTSSPRQMGCISESLRTWPGALRSAHPQTSFTALGPQAGVITRNHAMDCRLGEESPLNTLENMNAHVLLLGVGYDVCTSFHLAEYRVPGALSRKEATSFTAMVDGERKWVTVEDVELREDDFPELGADLERDHPSCVKRGFVGGAESRLFPLKQAVAYAQERFTTHRKDDTTEAQ